jgi:hypothetical protein
MKDLSQLDPHEKTILKLNDIYHLLFNNPGFSFMLTGKYELPRIDWVSLHKRLDTINTLLIEQHATGFQLNDVITFDPSINYNDDGKKNYGAEATEKCKQTNPEQYNRLPTVNTDQFLEGLSDPKILKKTFTYLIGQIQRNSQNKPIESADLKIPDSRMNPQNTQHRILPPLHPPPQITPPQQAIPQQQYPSPQQQYTTPPQQYTSAQQQNIIPRQQYTFPQPQNATSISPLTLEGNQIFYRPDTEYYQLYYNVVGDTGIMYVNVSGTFQPYSGPPIMLFAFVKNQMFLAHNNGNPLYIYVSGPTLLSGSMETGSFNPFQQFDLRKSPPELISTDA